MTMEWMLWLIEKVGLSIAWDCKNVLKACLSTLAAAGDPVSWHPSLSYPLHSDSCGCFSIPVVVVLAKASLGMGL